MTPFIASTHHTDANLRNSPKIAQLLPYPMCLAIITDEQMRRAHLDVSTQFVGIVRRYTHTY